VNQEDYFAGVIGASPAWVSDADDSPGSARRDVAWNGQACRSRRACANTGTRATPCKTRTSC